MFILVISKIMQFAFSTDVSQVKSGQVRHGGTYVVTAVSLLTERGWCPLPLELVLGKT